MTIWISRASLLAVLLAALLPPRPARAEVITQLPPGEKRVALTFDACETRTPAQLDHRISDYLVSQRIPFTLFVSGRFARHNQDDLRSLSKLPFVEIENHSMNHDNHMERLDAAAIGREVDQADALLADITGRHTRFFRFPAGNTSPDATRAVEAKGYKVVHWSFASGDPVRSIGATTLRDWVLGKTKPGAILIFHINGRGWSTGAALPEIVAQLKQRGYQFVRVDQALE